MHPEHGLRQQRNIKRRKNISVRNQGIIWKINILFSTIKQRICKRHSALLCRTTNLGVQFTNIFLNYWITQVQSRRAWFVCQNYIMNSHLWNWLNMCNMQKAWQIFHCLCIPGRPFLKQPIVLLKDGNPGQGFGFTQVHVWLRIIQLDRHEGKNSKNSKIAHPPTHHATCHLMCGMWWKFWSIF